MFPPYVKEVFSFGKCKISSYYEWRLISTAGKRKPVKRVSHLFSVSKASESAQEITFWYKKKMERNIWPHNMLISLYFLRTNLCRFYSKSNLHLHYLALGKVPFWLVAVFAYVASYTTSVFRNIFTPSRPHLLEKEGQPQHRELRALLFSNSAWVV